jgi:hypothetical protein
MHTFKSYTVITQRQHYKRGAQVVATGYTCPHTGKIEVTGHDGEVHMMYPRHLQAA